MKMGRVVFDIGYVVDLDNQDMVDHATQCVYEDVMNAIKYDEVGAWINTVEDATLDPEAIPEFLLETEEDD